MTHPDIEIRPFREEDQTQVVALWHACGLVVPWNDPHEDIAVKRRFQDELLLVGVTGERVVATVMAGYEGHRGWLNYLGVLPDYRGRGYARAIMAEAERRLRALGCPKINLQVRTSNRSAVPFYEHMGYSIDETISMGKRLDG